MYLNIIPRYIGSLLLAAAWRRGAGLRLPASLRPAKSHMSNVQLEEDDFLQIRVSQPLMMVARLHFAICQMRSLQVQEDTRRTLRGSWAAVSGFQPHHHRGDDVSARPRIRE